MSITELMELRNSNEAPFIHTEYTVWLHNRVIESVRRELMDTNNKQLLSLKSLQIIKIER